MHGAQQQLLERLRDAHGRVFGGVGAQRLPKRDALCGGEVLHRVVEQIAQEIPLTHRAGVFAFACEDGDGAIAVPAQLFEPLPQGLMFVQKSNFVLGFQKESDVHEKAPPMFCYHYTGRGRESQCCLRGR